MLNTCKSDEKHILRGVQYSGARVSNTWVTCLKDWDNRPKGLLIPDKTTKFSDFGVKVGLSMKPMP